MDFQERQKLVRRICLSKLYGNIEYDSQDYSVLIKDPSQDVLLESDFIYDNVYNKLVNDGVFTIPESYEILRKEGVWSEELESDLRSLKENLIKLKAKLLGLKFQKAQFRATKNLISKSEYKVRELELIKGKLYGNTAEYLAGRAKRRFILSKIATVTPVQDLLSNTVFQDVLSVYYYEDSAISEGQIRELARTDPWRLYWIASKDTGTPLFQHSCTEMTDLQYALVSWSRIYDFAYENPNRPTADIINDDDAFISWYEQECERINKDIAKNAVGKNIGAALGNSEVFIPADEEGAAEVYSLNDPQTRKVISQRQKALEGKDQLHEHLLPDVQQQLKLEANKMAMGAHKR